MKKLTKKKRNNISSMVLLYNSEVGALNNCSCNTKAGC